MSARDTRDKRYVIHAHLSESIDCWCTARLCMSIPYDAADKCMSREELDVRLAVQGMRVGRKKMSRINFDAYELETER